MVERRRGEGAHGRPARVGGEPPCPLTPSATAGAARAAPLETARPLESPLPAAQSPERAPVSMLHLWRNHEWLCEVAMAAVYDTAGVFGLKLMKLAAAATFVFLALAETETGASPTLQMVVLIGAAFGLAPEMQIRPQLCSFVLLAALIALLARDNYRRSAQLWLAIPILALWANLHGGFIVGIAALGAYSALAMIEDLISNRGFHRGLRLLSIAAGATAATLITPYGIETWYAVAHALSNPTTRRIISDWRPLHASTIAAWGHDTPGLIYLSFISLAMLAMAAAAARASQAGESAAAGSCGPDGGGGAVFRTEYRAVRDRRRRPAHPPYRSRISIAAKVSLAGEPRVKSTRASRLHVQAPGMFQV